MSKKLITTATIVGLTLAFSYASALAHSKDEQKCVTKMNKDLGKVAKFKGKDFTKCVKDTTKGKEADAQACFDSDPKGKVQKQSDKTEADATKKCADAGIAEDSVPGYTSALTVVAAGKLAIEDLVDDVFGGSMTGVISTDKTNGKCQAAVTKRLQKLVDTKFKQFEKCKKTLLKGGSDAIGTCITGNPDSVAADPKGKILKAVQKLQDDIGKKCPLGVATGLFPGDCNGLDGAALATCLDRLAECRVCEAINLADGTTVNCDLFDDGAANGTCSATIGTHKCTFDNSGASPGASTVTIITQALALAPFQAEGAIDINCGSADGGNGKAPCSCDVQNFEPIEIVAVGYVCFTPGDPCTLGEIDCDGGNALDVTMDSDHNVGTCTSNGQCDSICDSHCTGLGLNYFAAGCEGYCLGGDTPDAPCTNDTECSGGSCPGRNGAGQHPDVCNCDCTGIGGGASGAGTLQCNLSVNIDVEGAAPCGDGDVTIAVGTRCIPLTSESVTSQIHDTNNTGGKDFPSPAFTATGTGIDCNDLGSSITTGMNLVGSVNFFGSTIGDIHSQLDFTCQ